MSNLEQRSKQLFSSASVDPILNEINAANWLKAVAFLGDKWILAQPVQRKEK